LKFAIQRKNKTRSFANVFHISHVEYHNQTVILKFKVFVKPKHMFIKLQVNVKEKFNSKRQ